jgi:uroporphyrinogen III methyltransferase/synthase
MNTWNEGPGTVYVVGAGPGHPGLITRLGYELLQRCDAVAYDALIPLELIVGLPERIERHYVGKRAGRHSQAQEDINVLLTGLARRGLNVVRLKGGDPSLFGRSGEEASALSEAGIPVVVVPGVTAAAAAAAMSGFPLTDRRAASWVLLGTGHGAECSSIPVPWEKIAALSGGTIALYMGLGKLEQITGRLLAAGLPADTPCAAVQCASTGLQKTVDSPLRALNDECRKHGLKPPAMVFIGEVVRYRLDRPMISARPLQGRIVLVTSPVPETAYICGRLRDLGAEPIPYPTVMSKAADDVEGWARFNKAANSGGLCLFSDKVEVRIFVDTLLQRGLDLRSLGRFRVAALGRSTASALLERGIKADCVVTRSGYQGIIELLSREPSSCLVWVRGSAGNGFLQHLLREKYPEIIPLTVCHYATASWEARWKDALIESPPDYILFASALEVEGFIQLTGKDLLMRLSAESFIATMNASVAEVAGAGGLKVAVQAEETSIDAFLDALVRHSQGLAASVAEVAPPVR